MKNITWKKGLLVLVLLGNTMIFSQVGHSKKNRNQPVNYAPVPVQQSFQKENPDANDARWSQNNHEWRANYRDNRSHNVDAYYDRNGIHKDTHRALDKMDVPRNINRGITAKYGGNYRVARIERPNEAPVLQVKVQNSGRSQTLYMDEQGNKRQYNDHH